MWTETTRRQYRREVLRYASDMSDVKWALIEPHLGETAGKAAPRAAACGGGSAALSVAHRLALASAAARFSEPLDGAALPLRPGRPLGCEHINFLLLQQARERAGREASPSAGVIPGSSQSL